MHRQILSGKPPQESCRFQLLELCTVLEDCGIGQAAFYFLDASQKSSASNPWPNAMNLASTTLLKVVEDAEMASMAKLNL